MPADVHRLAVGVLERCEQGLGDHVAVAGRDALLHRTLHAGLLGHRDRRRERAEAHRVRGRDAAAECGQVSSVQPGRVHAAVPHHRVAQQVHQQVAVGAQAVDLGVGQSGGEAAQRLVAGRCPRDDLGDHRVVEGADLVAGTDAGVESDAGDVGALEPGANPVDLEPSEPAGLRTVARGGVLGVQAHLDRVARRLGHDELRERSTLGHRDLQRHEVDAEHGLGDGVLDLEPGVHLEEPETIASGVVEELDGPGPPVADGGRRGPGRVVQRGAGGVGQAGRRSLLDDLLVSSLHRAITLTGHQHPVGRADDLHLDVTTVLDVGLHEHGAVAERRGGLGGRGVDLGTEGRQVTHHPHAAPAAPRGRFDEERQVGLRSGCGGELAENRYSRLGHQCLGRDLGAHGLDRLGVGSYPGEPGIDHGTGEVGVLRQESVAGMHRVDAGA